VDETGPGARVPVDGTESTPAPGRVNEAPLYSRVTPTAPQRYAVQFTMDEAMHADLIRAQELLGPQADSDRVRAVFRRALRDLVQTLEKRKLAATDRPRAQHAGGGKTRAQVKREVRKRDQDRCAWVSADGKRCEERKSLQFDHIQPAGKGGGWTTENVRLLCPAHNQLAAEHEYGEGFMHRTRERNRDSAARRRAQVRAGDGVPATPGQPPATATPTPPPAPLSPP
jgi:5-methylcytosine-specific restriction endonuclease McrA